MYEYFDIHSHLNFPDYNDREEVIAEMKRQNIGTITVGTNFESSEQAVDLAKQHDNLFASIGLHPIDDPSSFFDEKKFSDVVKNPKVVAIGECGLDYSRLPVGSNEIEKEKKRQKNEFEKQIEFSVRYGKPLMIHCRDAYPDALEVLASKKREYGDKVRGNFHFFTSPIEIARQCLEIGFTVSFTGPVTFVKEYAEIVKYVPLEKMMCETDAPFAAPVPYRGKRNSPLYVIEIIKKVADIKGLSIDKVKKQLMSNVFELFLMEASS